ncbi:MAG: UbiA prenyltransferase family protein [Deltaproteobacteria bacterium]|nr:UbiA prenyltransferase family protein [Deltaproteobacteria bacterium]
MANLVAAGSIMVALQLPLHDIGTRLLFGFLLNLLVYLNNDFCDVDQDITSAKKGIERALYLKQHIKAAVGAQISILVVLTGLGVFYSYGLLIALVAGGGICWLYSRKLKRMPYLDVAAMILAGGLVPIVAFPLDSVLGWALVLALAIFSGCFESIQVMRDHDEDLASKVRTTAVRLGIPATMWMLRFFVIIAATYCTAVLNRYAGPVILLALFIPLDRTAVEQYWNRIRMITGVAWLGILVWIFLYGMSDGLLVSIDTSTVFDALTPVR